jgi:cytochrome b
VSQPQPRKPKPGEIGFLLLFHAAISGGFVVGYLTGDEDTYGMHLFAGYTALAALAARLAVMPFAPAGSILGLPRPSASPTLAWLRRVMAGDRQAMKARSPLVAWMAVAMLAFTLLTAVSGWVADRVAAVEDLHEAMAELTPAVILAHIAVALILHRLRQHALRQLAAPTAATAAS